MRLFRKQDASLLVGLAAALVIVFAAPISRLLDYVRDIEKESGLALLPGLVVLIVVLIFHELRKRNAIQGQVASAEVAKREAERRTIELERLVAFGHALARTLDHASITAAINQHLPRVAGTDQVWVLLLQGTKWECLTGDTRGAEQIIEREQFADALVGGARQSVDFGDVMGFPLVVGGQAMGVLGVGTSDHLLDADRHRALEAAAALLAVSLKNAQLFKEVRENSWRDSLTGCVTRTYAAEMIDAELRRARRSQTPVSAIMFDLDHFKGFNDKHGHLCGDAVLGAVGERLREVLRGSDLKCRYGGEEFLILLPETPLQGAVRVAETLRREISDKEMPWGGESLRMTASFGVTQVLPGEINAEAIVGRADAALYRAKGEGRNCVRTSSDTLTAVNTERPPNVAS